LQINPERKKRQIYKRKTDVFYRSTGKNEQYFNKKCYFPIKLWCFRDFLQQKPLFFHDLSIDGRPVFW